MKVSKFREDEDRKNEWKLWAINVLSNHFGKRSAKWKYCSDNMLRRQLEDILIHSKSSSRRGQPNLDDDVELPEEIVWECYSDKGDFITLS